MYKSNGLLVTGDPVSILLYFANLLKLKTFLVLEAEYPVSFALSINSLSSSNVPINFVAGSGSGTIGASSSGTISGSGSSWSYTGQNYIRNADSNPKSSATTFSGSGVTNGTAGVPSGGVSLTNFTGKYGRTA